MKQDSESTEAGSPSSPTPRSDAAWDRYIQTENARMELMLRAVHAEKPTDQPQRDQDLRVLPCSDHENQETPSKPNSVAGGDCAAPTGSVSFDVSYYSRGQRTHGYREEWEKLQLFCPNCGEKQVWHETGAGDYYVEELYMCGACGHGWHMPGGVTDQSNDEQGKQRLAWISQNA